MADEVQHLGIAHRYPRDMPAGHHLLGIGQSVGGHPAKARSVASIAAITDGAVLSQQRQHHPEPTPRQPRAKQLRANTIHARAVTEVVLKPNPGSGIHDRCTRRRPARYTVLASATARRGRRRPNRWRCRAPGTMTLSRAVATWDPCAFGERAHNSYEALIV
jgi:hypothetical protein